MTPEEFFAKESEALEKQWRAGSAGALVEAIVLFVANQKPLTPWVASALLEILPKVKIPGGRGRTGGVAASEKMNYIHFLRWDLARYWLDNRSEIPNFGAEKATRGGAFEITSRLLRGTMAQGSCGAIEGSFKMVQRAIKDGTAAKYDRSLG